MSTLSPTPSHSKAGENPRLNALMRQAVTVRKELENQILLKDSERIKILGTTFGKAMEGICRHMLESARGNTDTAAYLHQAEANMGRAYFDTMDIIIARKMDEIERIEARIAGKNHLIAKQIGEEEYSRLLEFSIALKTKLYGWAHNTAPNNRFKDYEELEDLLRQEDTVEAYKKLSAAANALRIPERETSASSPAPQDNFEKEYAYRQKNSEDSGDLWQQGREDQIFRAESNEENEIWRKIILYHNLAAATLKTWELTSHYFFPDAVYDISHAATKLYVSLITEDKAQRLEQLQAGKEQLMECCSDALLNLFTLLEDKFTAMLGNIPNYAPILSSVLGDNAKQEMDKKLVYARQYHDAAAAAQKPSEDSLREQQEAISILQQIIICLWKHQHKIDAEAAQRNQTAH